MKYIFLGKEVEVARLASNNTAQLTDGTWVPVSMLIQVESDESELKKRKPKKVEN